MSYSVRGVARRYLYVGGGFKLGDTFFPPGTTGPMSVRERLRALATREYSYELEECIYEWTAAYQQRWSRITVRVELYGVPVALPDSTMNMLRNTWESGIEAMWNDKWAIGRPGEATCPLEFDVQWVTSHSHHTVAVVAGPSHTNSGKWDTLDDGNVIAHEFGHLIGHPDEYLWGECPDRSPVDTGTVMDVADGSGTVPTRLMQGFADNVQSDVVGIVWS